MVEAGVAFFLLVFIVWWTMYQGQGKKPAPREQQAPAKAEQPGDGAQAPPRD